MAPVAVADNGDLYVTEPDGSVWRRTCVDWASICEPEEIFPFFDTVWFRGRLWCSAFDATYVLEDEELVNCTDAKTEPAPPEVVLHGSRMYVSPDGKKMLVCGRDGAVLRRRVVDRAVFRTTTQRTRQKQKARG